MYVLNVLNIGLSRSIINSGVFIVTRLTPELGAASVNWLYAKNNIYTKSCNYFKDYHEK